MLGCCCSGRKPDDLGVQPDGRLKPAPTSPNCVCSDAASADRVHYVDALVVTSDPAVAWEVAVSTMSSWALATVAQRDDDYMHVECSTKFWGFVDDLELHLRRPTGEDRRCTIAVRSASRLGLSDLGANRARVESLRSFLASAGVVASQQRRSDADNKTPLV